MRTLSEIIQELQTLVLHQGVTMTSIAKSTGVHPLTIRRLVQMWHIGKGKISYRTHFLLQGYLDKLKDRKTAATV